MYMCVFIYIYICLCFLLQVEVWDSNKVCKRTYGMNLLQNEPVPTLNKSGQIHAPSRFLGVSENEAKC